MGARRQMYFKEKKSEKFIMKGYILKSAVCYKLNEKTIMNFYGLKIVYTKIN